MVYKFAENAPVSGDPQVVGETLECIREKRGRLTARDVVEEARPEGHTLHRYFEWDDNKAAENYRADQARHLIRSVVVIEAPDVGEVKPVRAFVHVSRPDSSAVEGTETQDIRSYEPVRVALADPGMRAQVLGEVRDEIGRLRRKLDGLKAFGDLVAEIGGLEERVNGRLLELKGVTTARNTEQRELVAAG